MKKFMRLSLQKKIIGLVLLVVAMLFAGADWSSISSAKKLTKGFYGQTASAAKNLGYKIAAQFYERYGDVQAFAVNPSIKSLDGNRMQNDLNEYVSLYGIYDLIMVVDKHGYLVGVNSKDVEGKAVNVSELQKLNFKEEAWFKAVMKGEFTEDKERGFSGTYFQDFMMDSIYKAAFGEERLGNSFSAPIKNAKGEVIGVVTNRANKKWLEDELMATMQSELDKDIDNPEVTVTNGEGLIISYVNRDEKSQKVEFIRDPNRILNTKENFVANHIQAGKALVEMKSGAVPSKYITDDDWDLVGFHRMDEKKFIPSIGWTAWVHANESEVLAPIHALKRNFYIVLGMTCFIAIALAVWLGMVISKTVADIATDLKKNQDETTATSIKIAAASTQLSDASAHQAAALQETVAAVDEISAMVEKNSENATRSKDISNQSREAAEKGRRIVENMMNAIEQIDGSNNEISVQMDSSNRQLSEITKLINDIGSKTKVINEIVFQTKLLSFNASVEAARAGEYGKGFAVVAEEVGSLAAMSGTAAKEISGLLDESVRKVESIVVETKSQVERLMDNSKDKVRVGAETARQCNEALEEILQNVQSVDSMVAEIAVASSEQSTGIREISRAVGQLEQVTQQNSVVAKESSVSAGHLKEQSINMKRTIAHLSRTVLGSSDFEKVAKPQAEKKEVLKAKDKVMSKLTQAKKQDKPVVVKTEKKNVISVNFKKAKKNTQPTPEKAAPAVSSPVEPIEMKKATGTEATPSADDPGFAE